MIQNDDHLQAALATAERHLEARPGEGSPEREEFMRMLGDIAAYRPAVLAEASSGFTKERLELAERLKAFEARLDPDYGPHWQAMIGGDLRPKAASQP